VGIKTECDEKGVLEGYVLLKTRGLHRHVSVTVHLQAGMCKCGESANSLLFSEMHEIHGKHTAMQRWGILESSQKCFFVVQALINNNIYKVNAYMTHTTYMIFDWYVD
jgi:hypothetical protein